MSRRPSPAAPDPSSPPVRDQRGDHAEATAAEFLKVDVDDGGPWTARFNVWARAQGLTEAEAYGARVQVLRARVFGATSRAKPPKPARSHPWRR